MNGCITSPIFPTSRERGWAVGSSNITCAIISSARSTGSASAIPRLTACSVRCADPAPPKKVPRPAISIPEEGHPGRSAHQAVCATGDGAACKRTLPRRKKMTELLLHISGALPNVHNFRRRLIFVACNALDVTLHSHPDHRRGGGPCGNNGASGKICRQLHQSDLHAVERPGLSLCDDGRTCRIRQRVNFCRAEIGGCFQKHFVSVNANRAAIWIFSLKFSWSQYACSG